MDGSLASRRVAAGGVAAIVVGVAWRASVDLDPGSLWLDDAWMGALAQAGSWSELNASPSSAPIGVKLLVAAALALGFAGGVAPLVSTAIDRRAHQNARGYAGSGLARLGSPLSEPEVLKRGGTARAGGA